MKYESYKRKRETHKHNVKARVNAPREKSRPNRWGVSLSIGQSLSSCRNTPSAMFPTVPSTTSIRYLENRDDYASILFFLEGGGDWTFLSRNIVQHSYYLGWIPILGRGFEVYSSSCSTSRKTSKRILCGGNSPIR